MSRGAIAVTLLLIVPLAVWVGVEIARTEIRRRRWARERPRWWTDALPSTAIRQSVTVAGQPSSVEVVEVRDPRKVRVQRLSRKLRAHRGTSAAARATFDRTVVQLGIRQEVP